MRSYSMHSTASSLWSRTRNHCLRQTGALWHRGVAAGAPETDPAPPRVRDATPYSDALRAGSSSDLVRARPEAFWHTPRSIGAPVAAASAVVGGQLARALPGGCAWCEAA